MGKIQYTIIHEIDKDLLCDEETIKNDFDNSWQKFMEWFFEEEPAEVIYGLDENPKLGKVKEL